MYTDHTLTRVFVAVKKKMRQIDTITEWFGNLTCGQKKGLSKNRGENVHGYYEVHFTFKLIFEESKLLEFDTFPKWFGNLTTCQKGYLEKIEAKMYTDHTLTRKFVALKIKCRQIDTITQWNWDRSCQKKKLVKNSRQKCTRIMHLPVSWLL